MRRHPLVYEKGLAAAQTYGAGSGASPLLGGFHPCHEALLEQLKVWKQKPHGMLFNTGFMANQALLKRLPGPDDLILCDRLIHHSMIQALDRSQTRFKRYEHLKLDALENELKKAAGDYQTLFVVSESVFSMDGDYPDLKRLAQLRKEYGFIWILDEAHGTGVYGAKGAGLAEEMGVADSVDILIGTLGKAIGSMGAYVLSQRKGVIDYLSNHAGEYIYSTFLPPFAVGAASAAIELIQKASPDRQRLRERAVEVRQELTRIGYEVNPFDSPIIPVMIGDSEKAVELSRRFLEENILIGAVRPPTVPVGTERLRLSLHTGLSDTDIQRMIDLFSKWKA